MYIVFIHDVLYYILTHVLRIFDVCVDVFAEDNNEKKSERVCRSDEEAVVHLHKNWKRTCSALETWLALLREREHTSVQMAKILLCMACQLSPLLNGHVIIQSTIKFISSRICLCSYLPFWFLIRTANVVDAVIENAVAKCWPNSVVTKLRCRHALFQHGLHVLLSLSGPYWKWHRWNWPTYLQFAPLPKSFGLFDFRSLGIKCSDQICPYWYKTLWHSMVFGFHNLKINHRDLM